MFSGGGGLFGKLKHVTRLEFLWDHVRQKGVEMPEFVHNFDEEMDCRPTTLVDYGLESDYPGILPSFDSTISTYSMRCIA
ncbi:hypothetical protein C2S52_022447 [Perilla frutescens var. hirtella]|nr:hypothetical protein C2S52_022447 [Perilla frutescens var. hirtella]